MQAEISALSEENLAEAGDGALHGAAQAADGEDAGNFLHAPGGQVGGGDIPGFFREQGGESIGCALFLDEAEARAAHRRAVLTLFRIRYPEMFTHMRSYAKLGRSLEHEFFPDDPDWRADLTDNAVARAIGCPPESVRRNPSATRRRSTMPACACGTDWRMPCARTFRR